MADKDQFCEKFQEDQRTLLARTSAILSAVGAQGQVLGQILAQLGSMQEQVSIVEARIDDHETRIRELEKDKRRG